MALHDTVAQGLTGLNLNLSVLRMKFPAEADTDLARRLDAAISIAAETTRMVRHVLTDLQPPLLEEYGLLQALHNHALEVGERISLDIRVIPALWAHPRLGRDMEIVLFRIAQEALHNVAKHARATRVLIALRARRGSVTLGVADNGQGFNRLSARRTGDTAHWGLLHMRERAGSVGGTLRLVSVPGRGTTVAVCVKWSDKDDNNHPG
jgi:signal transduction histidine kinase